MEWEIERTPVKSNTDEAIKELSIKLTAAEKVIENLNKTLERYEIENKAMRSLLQLWI